MKLEFWFDYSCPYAYLASTQVEGLAASTQSELVYSPMLLGGVFAAVGTAQNLSSTLSPAKAAHNGHDMMRWADAFGVPLIMPAEHPRRTVEALRLTLAARMSPSLIHRIFRAYWVENRDIASLDVLRQLATDAGHSPALADTLDTQKDELRRRTDEAIKRGVFGAPSFFVGDELFWGQDRMHFVEAALLGKTLSPSLLRSGA